MKTLRRAHALIAALQPIVGTSCTGVARATLKADVAGPVVLCKGTIGYPILASAGGNEALDTSLALLTTADVSITAGAGADVPFASTWGSGLHNFPAGTRIRWYRPPAGVELAATCVAGASGAVAGDVRRCVLYETIGAGVIPRDLWLAKAGSLDTYPTIVVSWEGSQDYESMGADTRLRADRWAISLVVARNSGAVLRAAEGVDLLDDIEEILVGREGSPFGALSKPGLEVLDRKRFAVSDTSYVYQVNVATRGGVRRRDRREFPPWIQTLYDYTTTANESPEGEPPIKIIDGAIYAQQPEGFSEDFSGDFEGGGGS